MREFDREGLTRVNKNQIKGAWRAAREEDKGYGRKYGGDVTRATEARPAREVLAATK